MSLFTPDATFPCFLDVSADFLKSHGITVLLLDIDNTLAPYEQPTPDARTKEWLSSLAAEGIAVGFLSNNHDERVSLFNESLGLPYRCDAYKPLPKQAKRMIARLGGTKKTAALMGDQIFTDILCAHLAGVKGFLVPPIKDRTDKGTRFKRYFERGILKRYYKKHSEERDIRHGSPLSPKEGEHNA